MSKQKIGFVFLFLSVVSVLYFSCNSEIDSFDSDYDINFIVVNDQVFTYEIFEGDIIIQGDIIIAKEEDGEEAIKEGIRELYFNESESGTKAVHPDLSRRWPDGIVYYFFHKDYPQNMRPYVLEAMKWWSSVSNIQFIEQISMNHIYIKQSSRNSSYVGMISGSQTVNIYNMTSPGIIAHELGHALGLKHTHQRSDRDKYIKLYRYNSYLNNDSWNTDFGKLSSNYTWGETYDFDSIMHYHWHAFGNSCNVGDPECYEAINNYTDSTMPRHYLQPCTYGTYCYKMVISVNGDDEYFSQTAELGQTTHLSALDIDKVRVMYGYPADTGTWNSIGDYNNDDRPDLYFFNTNSGAISISQTSTTGGSSPTNAGDFVYSPLNDTDSWTFSGDFNGDGRTDIGIWRSDVGELWLGLVLYNRIYWVWAYSGSLFSQGDTLSWKFTGDFNNDGKTDIGIWNKDNGSIYIGYFNKNRFEFHVAYSNSNWKHIPYDENTWRFIGDLNGDGKTDIGFWESNDNTNAYYSLVYFGLSDGTNINFRSVIATSASTTLPSNKNTWRFTGDFNNDGKMDLGYWNGDNGNIYLSSSNSKVIQFYSITSNTIATPFVSGWNIIPTDVNTWRFTGDFDGDKKTDIGFWHGGSGEIWHTKSSLNYGFYTKSYSNKSWKHLPSDYATWKFTGDFNNDGKTDIGFWRRDTGDIYFGYSENYKFNFSLVGNYNQ